MPLDRSALRRIALGDEHAPQASLFCLQKHGQHACHPADATAQRKLA